MVLLPPFDPEYLLVIWVCILPEDKLNFWLRFFRQKLTPKGGIKTISSFLRIHFWKNPNLIGLLAERGTFILCRWTIIWSFVHCYFDHSPKFYHPDKFYDLLTKPCHWKLWNVINEITIYILYSTCVTHYELWD